MKKKMMRTQLITLRIPRETLKQIDLLALERERYRSEVILEAVQQYLKKDRALNESGNRSQPNKMDS